MDGLPSHDLELKAADERRRLEGSVRELRARLEYDFDVRRRIERNLGLATGAAIVVGLLSGYWMTGSFLR
jgi:hypothetical protein